MSNSNGGDSLRLRQLRAMAENLCSLANWHRENHSYIVADALYGRALYVAEQIPAFENDRDTLIIRIRTGQQAAFEMLSAGEIGPDKPPSGRAQKVGL